MKGKSADIEARELTFKVYRECGGNVEMTLRELDKQGYKISKPTLYDWIEKFDFKGRMAQADIKAQEARDLDLTLEMQVLSSLNAQKVKFEKYFESLGTKIDTQAQYAYSNVLMTMINIKAKLGADKKNTFLDFMRDFVNYLSKEDVEAVPYMERNFDGFVSFAREKYGN